MIRFAKNEYIRNFWYNLCTIVLLVVMMIISITLISNYEQQAKLYKFASKYIDENTMFFDRIRAEYIDELDSFGEIIGVHTYDAYIGSEYGSHLTISVHTEEMLKKLTPRLNAGKYPGKKDMGEDTICILISENPYGIGAGDEFVLNGFGDTSDETSTLETINCYVSGVISDGQRIYTDISHTFSDMTYEDFFPIHTYEQFENVRIIVPESEGYKIPDGWISYLGNVILNPDDGLSKEQLEEIRKIVNDYRTFPEYPLVYPEADELIERSKAVYDNDMMRNIPLCVVVLILFGISIIGVVSVKTSKSIRHYGIMYVSGMKNSTAPVISGIEMIFNCIVSVVMALSLLKLQNTMSIIGDINCYIGKVEVISLIIISLVITIDTMLTTRSILKEHTLIEIVRNKV